MTYSVPTQDVVLYESEEATFSFAEEDTTRQPSVSLLCNDVLNNLHLDSLFLISSLQKRPAPLQEMLSASNITI